MVLWESQVVIVAVNRVVFVICRVVMLLVLVVRVLLVVLAVPVESDCRGPVHGQVHVHGKGRVRQRVLVSTVASWICLMVKSVVLVVMVESVVSVVLIVPVLVSGVLSLLNGLVLE